MNDNEIQILHFVSIASALACLENNIRYINKVINPAIDKDKLVIGNYNHHAFNRILSDVDILRVTITELWKDIYGWTPGVEYLIDISKDYQIQKGDIFEQPFKWHLIRGSYEDYDAISRYTNSTPLIHMIGEPLVNICERIYPLYNSVSVALSNITDKKWKESILSRIGCFCNKVRAFKSNVFADDEDYELSDSLIEDLKTTYKSANIARKAAIRQALENITEAMNPKDFSTVGNQNGGNDEED